MGAWTITVTGTSTVTSRVCTTVCGSEVHPLRTIGDIVSRMATTTTSRFLLYIIPPCAFTRSRDQEATSHYSNYHVTCPSAPVPSYRHSARWQALPALPRLYPLLRGPLPCFSAECLTHLQLDALTPVFVLCGAPGATFSGFEY